MTRQFDSGQLMELGWRQGAILDRQLALSAWDHAPDRLDADEQDHLVVASHDCDILNASLAKEPLVEVLRARVPDAAAGQRSHHSAGRNPRALRLSEVAVRGDAIALDFVVHDRWEIPRELLMEEAPAARLPDGKRRLVAEWLAKRYIRAAFPTAFDARWRGESQVVAEALEAAQPVDSRGLPAARYPGRAYRRRSVQVRPAPGNAQWQQEPSGLDRGRRND